MTVQDAIDLLSFDPSRKRGEAVAARMQTRLADSLRYVLDQAQGQVLFSRSALDALLNRLGDGPVSPLVFGTYCDLVLALEADALDSAKNLLSELAAAPNVAPGSKIVDFAKVTRTEDLDRYRRFANTDADSTVMILPAAEEHVAFARRLIDEAFALMDAGNPSLAAEIRAILREIVLAGDNDDSAGMQFEGVSTFMLWGASILNARGQKTALDMVQTLAHESGHNLLFGMCAYGPLHENEDEGRYSSPLRSDPRPMDGVVHATYVTARMHQSVQRLADSGTLDALSLEQARAANTVNVQNFIGGMEVVRRHARLTELGRTVMGSAERYMAGYS